MSAPIHCVPTEEEYELAKRRKYDDFYVIPPRIAQFMVDLQGRLPEGYTVRPWTMNRAITVFAPEGGTLMVTYEVIEDAAVDMVEYVLARLGRFN